jgi:hypothetical protein
LDPLQNAGAASTEVTPTSAVVAPGTEVKTATAPASVLGATLLSGDPGAADTGAVVLTDEQKATAEAEAAAAKAIADTPPDYSALKLPDGVKTGDPLFDAFIATAGEHKLSPDAAQALIDKVLPDLSAQMQTLRDEPVRLATERLKEWEQAIHADPEIGGAKLNDVKTNVSRAMAQYGNPDEIKAAMNETGAGSNPVLIKWLNKMASALSEGTPVTGGNPVFPKPSVADRMYDNPTSKRVAA